MSNVKLISDRKKFKNIEKNGWNDRFHLGKMDDYPKKNTLNSNYLTKFKIRGSESNKKKMFLKHQNQTIVNIDEQIFDLWQYLGVNENYKYYFQQKLSAFKENLQNAILEIEQRKLEQVQELVNKIDRDYQNKEKNIEKLQKINLFIQNETNFHTNDKIYIEIKSNLENIKKYYLSFIKNIILLSEKAGKDIKNGKYNISKMQCSTLPFEFIESEGKLLIDLIQDLNFIKNGHIGTLFNIKSNFDVLITDYNSQNANDSSKDVSEISYTFINEMTYKEISKNSNQNPSTSIGTGKRIKSRYHKETVEARDGTRHCRQAGHVNNYNQIGEKEIIECRTKGDEDVNKNNKNDCRSENKLTNEKIKESKEEEKSNYAHDKEKKNDLKSAGSVRKIPNKKKENDFKNKTESQKSTKNLQKDNEEIIIYDAKKDDNSIDIQFFKGNISSFKTDYSNYYNNIPSNQKITFHLKNDISSLVAGMNPMIITKYINGSLDSLISLSYSSEDIGSLVVNHFSCKDGELLKSSFEEFIQFLNGNNVVYNSIYVNLFYQCKDGIFSLDKDINLIWKQLKFRWVKLENIDNETRYQKMQLKNASTNIKTEQSVEPIISINSSLILIQDNDNKSEPPQNEIEKFNKFLNSFNLFVGEKIGASNQNELNTLSELLPTLSYKKGENKDDLNKFLSIHNIEIENTEINTEITNFIAVYFNFCPIFDSIMTLEINNKMYHRISSKIEVLLEKETQQKFYMIVTNDSSTVLLAELNDKCKDVLSKDNLYKTFSDFNSKIEPLSTENVGSIYLPMFNSEQINYSSNLPFANDNIEVRKAFNYSKVVSSYDTQKKQILSINPTENDIVIKNEFFIGIMNYEISNAFNVPSIFCALITPN